MDLALNAIDAAKALVRAKIDAGAPGTAYWNAAQQALEVVATKKDDLVNVGVEGFKHLLTHVAISEDLEEIERAISTMDASQIIDQINAGTAELQADTQAARERKARMLEIAQELGIVGARLILSLIV